MLKPESSTSTLRRYIPVLGAHNRKKTVLHRRLEEVHRDTRISCFLYLHPKVPTSNVQRPNLYIQILVFDANCYTQTLKQVYLLLMHFFHPDLGKKKRNTGLIMKPGLDIG